MKIIQSFWKSRYLLVAGLCVFLMDFTCTKSSADTFYGADLNVTYVDWGSGTVPTYEGSDQVGGPENSLIRTWDPKPTCWEAYFDTANIVEGLSIHSINDLSLFWVETNDIFYDRLTANVRSGAVLNDVVSVSETELADGGYLQFFISLTGALSHELRPQAGGYNVRKAEAEVIFRIQGRGGLNRQIFNEKLVASTVSEPINEVFNDLTPFSQPYIPTPLYSLGPGEQFSLAFQLETGISFTIENIDGGLIDYFGTADVRNTAIILGAAIFDPEMNLVRNATLISQRGLIYPNMAPLEGECGDPNHPYPDGDFDRNCRIDLEDVALFASFWSVDSCTSPGWCEGRDLSQDGMVEMTDLRRLMDVWLLCTAPICQ